MNDDVISRIYSYLPVREERVEKFVKNITEEIEKRRIYKKWTDNYSRIWSEDQASYDYYFNWLENDICRWANNDIGTMREITVKYKSIMARLGRSGTSYVDFEVTNIKSPAEQEFMKIYNVLNIDEVNQLDTFLGRLHLFTEN